MLILEASFLCCLAPAAVALRSHLASACIVASLRLLLFKLLFSSAVSKLSEQFSVSQSAFRVPPNSHSPMELH